MFKSSSSQGEADQDKNGNEQDYLDWRDVDLIFTTFTYILNSNQDYLDWSDVKIAYIGTDSLIWRRRKNIWDY